MDARQVTGSRDCEWRKSEAVGKMYDDGDDVVVGVGVHMIWSNPVNGGRCLENENEAGVQ